MNLVNNAVYAMEGKGTLTLLWRHAVVDPAQARKLGLKSGHHLVVGIRDTGCGIDPKYAGEVFGPFFSTKPPGEGTGLGLSVSAQIVKAWNGALDFVSGGPNAGTTFSIYLPIDSRAADGPQAKS
jgi:signal transduction histidine kinase